MKQVKKYTSNFITLVLATVLLMSTSGFRIYTHTCNHKHTQTYSLLIPVKVCHHQTSEQASMSCCQTSTEKQTCSHCALNHSEKNCCSDQQKVVKLNTKTVLAQSLPELKVNLIQICPVIPFCQLHLELSAIETGEEVSIKESPPPVSTPQYLSKIQVYRI